MKLMIRNSKSSLQNWYSLNFRVVSISPKQITNNSSQQTNYR